MLFAGKCDIAKMSKMFWAEIGDPTGPPVLFGHGWGRDHRDFIPVAEAIAPYARSVLLDLPGFGASERPKDAWGTAQYADYIRRTIENEFGFDQYIWVGHSFGGRIGLRLAASGEHQPSNLLIVAGAGLKRSTNWVRRLHSAVNSRRFKFAKRFARSNDEIAKLEESFGSTDYVKSRSLGMRDIFIRTVTEDQAESVKWIGCPTTLIYGGRDHETPPEIGERLRSLIPNSELIICPEFDHIELLDRGRHQIALTLKDWLVK